MPGTVAPSASENTLLAEFVVAQVDGLRGAGYGLTGEQLRATPTASALSVGALMVHGCHTAGGWLDRAEAAPGRAPSDAVAAEDWQASYADDFRVREEDTAASLDHQLDELAQRVRALVPGLDLDAQVPVPDDSPWWPRGVDGWSVRWVLLHLVQELARHAGHADIIRESIDGATMYELMAGREGWPATEWLTPWQPPAS